MYEPIVANRPP